MKSFLTTNGGSGVFSNINTELYSARIHHRQISLCGCSSSLHTISLESFILKVGVKKLNENIMVTVWLKKVLNF